MRSLAAFSVRHPIPATMLVGILLGFGVISLTRLGLDLLPELSFPAVSILTRYEGAAPEDVENLITRPIEEAVSTIAGVKSVRSLSLEGFSLVTVEFAWGKNLDAATQDVRDRVGFIEDFLPRDAQKPVILKFDPSFLPILEFGVTSERRDLHEVRRILEDEVKYRLERVDGVASVILLGAPERVVLINLDPARLAFYGISLNQVVQALRAANLNLPAGHLKEAGREYVLRGVGAFERLEDIRQTVVGASRGGTPVFLRDLGEVTEGLPEVRYFTRNQGKDALLLLIYKQSGTNTVKVADAVKAEMAALRGILPRDIQIHTVFDQSRAVKKIIYRTGRTAIYGGLLAALIIFLFLRAFQATLVISLAMPLSVIITFTVIHFTGHTLNMMTLGGIALGIGMLVDNAVVVIENIFRHRELGDPPDAAAIEGTTEVGLAISASTFTTVIVFLPLVYVGGVVGKITEGLALAVVSTLLASLLVALTVIPGAAHLLFRGEVPDFGRRAFRRYQEGYRRLLRLALRHRWKVIGGAFGLFFLALALIPWIGGEFIPRVDQDYLYFIVELPVGSTLEETDHYVRQIEELAMDLPEVMNVSTFGGLSEITQYDVAFGAGARDVNQAEIYLRLVDRTRRKRHAGQIAQELLARVPPYRGAAVRDVDVIKTMFLGAEGKPLTVKIFGKDLEVLRTVAEAVRERLARIPGVVNPEVSLQEAKPEVRFRVKRLKAARYGFPPYTVVAELEAGLKGKEAGRLRERGEELDLIVRLDPRVKKDLTQILTLPLRSPVGTTVPLSELVEVEEGQGPVAITREKQSRVVSVSADLAGRDLLSAYLDVRRALRTLKLPPGYLVEAGGEALKMLESFRDLGFVFAVAVILVYMVMAAQFEAFLHPFVVMFTVPLAITGALFALLLTHNTLSIVSGIGVLILAGVAVNNAIVMVDYINRLRRRGLPPLEAVIEGATVRLRPVLITATTTILGMVPMAVSRAEGAEIRGPMAVAVIGGLLVATFLTLFVIPSVYTVMERIPTGGES